MNEIVQRQMNAYHKASNVEKSKILDSLVLATGANRKSLIRALGRKYKDNKAGVTKKLGRPVVYSSDVTFALKYVWEIYGSPCGERLHSELAEAIRILNRDKLWPYGNEITNALLNMSLATMKRRITKLAYDAGLARGISTTNSSGSLKQVVPVFKGNYARMGLGYGELDTVAHCGIKLMGTFIYSLTYVDMETYWIEPIAQFNKTVEATLLSIQRIQQRLPWVVQGLHPDNGSEFLNYQLVDYCKRKGIKLTRSRPYKKNDNCHIEERNRHVIRKYVGYERFDHPDVVVVLNELYEAVRLYVNFFQPIFKVTRDEKYVNKNGIKVKRYGKKKYTIKTPYARAMESKQLPMRVKLKLKEQYESLNPKVLRDRIDSLQLKVSKLQKQLGYHYDANLKLDR